MNGETFPTHIFKQHLFVAALAGSLSATAALAGDASAKPTVITLTQIACQFIESEDGIYHGYSTTRKADCEAFNDKTGDERVVKAAPLTLKAGDYIFRVTNKNVSCELGFWVRGDGLLNRAHLPSVSGGGLVTGKAQDYKITLKPGE
ncbi:hypothetical protein [Pelagibius sp. Alg239-R121]|uniref:hypothetical protein n=1 Tax=Pelagibius sp. Alg239-R121 TaxID=2993448 RepID=UPI0024A61976|nr:hypothetical protein [Pelagibius sp. Alg239-R121]